MSSEPMSREDVFEGGPRPAALATDHEPRRKWRALAIWAALRVPAILILIFLFRDWIVTRLDDPHYLTVRAIEIVGTPLARVLLFLLIAAALMLLYGLARKLGELRGYWLTVVLAAAFMLVLFTATGTPRKLAAPVLLLLATNLAPDRLWRLVVPAGRGEDRFMALAAGLAELLFVRRYFAWITELWTGRHHAAPSWWIAALPAILLASALTAVLVRSPHLADIERELRLTPSARIFARGDFNWIELDAKRQHLFVTGHGTRHILRYDLSNLDQAPLQSPVDTGGAQAFAYEQTANELYVYNSKTRQLLVLDAGSLELKRSFPIAALASGDSWLAADRATSTVTIVSEADQVDGKPFIVVDSSTGQVRDRRDLDSGNILLVPQTSRLYLSFFRRSERLMTYELHTSSISAEVPAPHHADRMAFVERNNELLLAAPAHSQIVRYDAATLARRGEIAAILGVRVLAVDGERNLVLCGSFLTGEIAVIDLASSKILSRVYLGPWLRTIQVDAARGVAYASSNGALYELKYDDIR